MAQNTTLDNFITGEFKPMALTTSEYSFLHSCKCAISGGDLCVPCLAFIHKEKSFNDNVNKTKIKVYTDEELNTVTQCSCILSGKLCTDCKHKLDYLDSLMITVTCLNCKKQFALNTNEQKSRYCFECRYDSLCPVEDCLTF